MSEQANKVDSLSLLIGHCLQGQVNRNLLKYAAGRAIFCPECHAILDCRSCVIGHHDVFNRECVICCSCWDKRPDKAAFSDVIDGRQLFTSGKPRAPRKPRGKRTFKERLEAGLLECGWERDWSDKSRYNAWKKAGEAERYFTGPSGALRRGECASRSYSVGDPTAIRPKYAYFLQAGDERLEKGVQS